MIQESIHEEQLRSLLEDDEPHLQNSVDPKDIHSYIKAMEVPDELDYKKAVKVAYDKENASQMLYTILSNMVQSEPISKMLSALAQQEKKHKEFFAKEYDRIRLGEN